MRFLLPILLLVPITFARDLPHPLPDHPGNIFVAGEHVVVSVPKSDGAWKLLDYEKKSTDVTAKDGKIDLGELGVGYYELRNPNAPDKITLGVIAPLKAPTPDNSPISIDEGMAWFHKTPATQQAVISLMRMAGVNWVRDRLSWPEMEPTRGTFAGHNIYDDTATVQTEAGLKILQVSHISPPWANAVTKRFPTDLRDVYNFNREMAKRWKGKVLAMEPWNEADIDVFGGHTGGEIATLQKAAYFGQKAGNPEIITCQNVFAIARQTTLDDFGANDASAYFDTYNLHHYIGFDKYPAAYAAHRAVSGGKPMWVTECNLTVHWEGDPKKAEPNDDELRAASRRLAKIFAMSIYEGSVNTFYFILPHYVERNLQFGLLHEDFTPRPAYVSMAAVGRLMAGASSLGKLHVDDPKVHGYLFRAQPDGKDKFVFVGWIDGPGEKTIKLDAPVEAMFDHLGREMKGSWVGQMKLRSEPTFAVMPIDPSVHMELEPPHKPPARSDAKPVPLVVQALPTTACKLDQSAYTIAPGEQLKIPLCLYNFGEKAAKGELKITGPSGWGVEMESTAVEANAGERKPLPDLSIDPKELPVGTIGTFKIEGDFADTGKTVLSFRLIVEPPPAKEGY